jgi:predicted membrane chloride channel (bestrophin family)
MSCYCIDAPFLALERILTTPLPLYVFYALIFLSGRKILNNVILSVYSVHIRHTVWIYLTFLPFQLISQFKWYTIPGVAMAAFIYLGFVAAGEEIEQPFGA